MTEKLYYKDSYIKEFTAIVLSCKIIENGYCVLLDKTAFFPESGGQCSDVGFVGEAKVIYVFEKEGEIYHITDTPLNVGSYYCCKLNFDRRFRNMQNHSGEHIISGVIHNHFGYDNVGFHLGVENVTADFNGKLTKDEILLIESEANNVVFSNLNIKAYFLNKTEAENIDYRSKSEICGELRIVEIENIDYCACCAPHVNKTGEIGLIKITDFEAYKGGTRIYIKCGVDALKDYNDKYRNILAISDMLSAKRNETADAVARLIKENDKLKHENSLLKQKILLFDLEKIEHSDDYILIEHNSNDMIELCTIAKAYSEKSEKFAIALYSNEDDITFTAISKSFSLLEIADYLRKNYSAKCGGKENVIQGKAQISLYTFKSILDNFCK